MRTRSLHREPSKSVVIFLNDDPPADALAHVSNQADDEAVALGPRAVYVFFGNGQGRSKLKIPAAKSGTARNLNTVAALLKMVVE